MAPRPAIIQLWFIGLLYFAQDAQVVNAQYKRKILSQCAIYGYDLREIVLISPMLNICARFAQDSTPFPNAQYMRKIVLTSSMRNICARFAQDCTYFPNAQYMRKILLFTQFGIHRILGVSKF